MADILRFPKKRQTEVQQVYAQGRWEKLHPGEVGSAIYFTISNTCNAGKNILMPKDNVTDSSTQAFGWFSGDESRTCPRCEWLAFPISAKTPEVREKWGHDLGNLGS